MQKVICKIFVWTMLCTCLIMVCIQPVIATIGTLSEVYDPGGSSRYGVKNNNGITGEDIVKEARKWANVDATYWSGTKPWEASIYWRTGYTYQGQTSFDCSGFVGRVLNDCGLRSPEYTPDYGNCILSQNYGSGYIAIKIEDLVKYGEDITAAVQKAKKGDYSDLLPGDIIGWVNSGRHVIIYAGIKNGKPWMVEFTGYGYYDRAITSEYQNKFENGARLINPNSSSYFTQCSELYPSYGKATVKTACNPHPLPCSNTVAQKYGASSPAMTDKALSPGQSIEINGIIMNTEGHYWYKVTLSDGTSAYVFSNECMEMELLNPYFSGDILPDQISGATYLGGEIISRGARIDSVQAIVYHNNNDWDQAITSDVVYVNATDKYALYKSQVDYSLPFQNLTAGYYFINIHAGITRYHLSADKTLVAKKAEYLIAAETFTYGNPGTCSHSYSSTVTAPTCTQQGYTTYTCTKCGNSYIGNTVNALGHDYKTFVTEPTCTEQGYTAYACSRGDDLYYSNYVAAKGHSYSEWYTDSTQANAERRNCINCSHYETRNSTASHEHSYTSVEIAPTCEEEGYTTYTCSICGDSYVDNIVADTGHQYGEWYEYEAATCIGAGVNRSDCIICASCTYTKVPPLGHNYQTSIAAPTCTEQGYTTYTCTTCGDGYIDNYVDPTGHRYGDWYPVSTPADTSRRDCLDCSHYETMSTACDHSYTSVEKPSTCTTEGEIIKTCVKCGFSYQHCVLGPKGHSMGNWYLAKPATATENGYEQRDCQNCSHCETRILPATQLPSDSTQPTTPPSSSTIVDQLLNNPTVLIVAGCVCMAVVLVIGIAIGKKKK